MAIVLLDASEPISEQDQRILTMVIEAGRALVIAFNKWDLVDEDRRYYLDKEIDRELRRIPWADPGQRVGARPAARSTSSPRPCARRWPAGSSRVPTGQLNQWLTALVQATPHPVRGGRAPRVLFATQAGTARRSSCCSRPGRSTPATCDSWSASCARSSPFTGTPIHITVKPRKKQGRR